MARVPKPSGRLSSGPWTYTDLLRALRRDRWDIEADREHVHLVHPERPGRKVQLSKKWTGVKVGSDEFRGIAENAGYSTRDLKRLLNDR
jgi:hypothetical protein